jgi:hypothetical protein
MGMRKSTRQELRKLREIVREVFEITKDSPEKGVSVNRLCFFCNEPLIDGENSYHPGDGEGSPIDSLMEFTLHHKDGNHSNNKHSNRKWSHRRCHKSHHLTERHAQNRKLKAKTRSRK